MRLSSTPARLQRFRQKHKRIDFYPSPDVADIIAHHLATGAEKCLSGVLDALIRDGHTAVSGNRGSK
jgi:hypothetical protein